MEAKTIKKKDMSDFLDRLIGTYLVIAPVKREGHFLFEAIGSGSDARLDYHNTRISPKGALFPQSETLFRYQSNITSVEIDPRHVDYREQILFGVRPCDAGGIRLLDRVFGETPEDPYYTERRAKTIIVGLGCNEPNNGCFCTSLDGGPCAQEGSDLLLIDIGGEYLVRIVSEKGRTLLEKEDFRNAGEDQISAAAGVIERAEKDVKPALNMEGSEEILDRRFNDPVWDAISEKCIGCGICTYVCPACHCFDINDETVQKDGYRIRIWDSCQYPLFTEEASGHNPRDGQGKRMRQRIMHKFRYLPETQNMPGCTGCGRCISECPVNLDIYQVMKTLFEAGEEK